MDRAVRRAAAASDARRRPGRGRDPALLPPAPRRHRRRRPGARRGRSRRCRSSAGSGRTTRRTGCSRPISPRSMPAAPAAVWNVVAVRKHDLAAKRRIASDLARAGGDALPPRRARVLLAHDDAPARGARRRDRARRGPLGRPMVAARARHGRRARLDRRGLRRDRRTAGIPGPGRARRGARHRMPRHPRRLRGNHLAQRHDGGREPRHLDLRHRLRARASAIRRASACCPRPRDSRATSSTRCSSRTATPTRPSCSLPAYECVFQSNSTGERT